MTQTYIVYVIYGKDEETLRAVMDRLIEKGITFSFSGEYIYGNTPWDDFISEHCSDLEDRLDLSTEHWADNCLGYETVTPSSVVSFYVEGVLCARVEVAEHMVDPVKSLMSKLCGLAAPSINVQYNINQLPR